MTNKSEISIINDKGSRYYLIPGVSEPLPSVTSILSMIAKPGLIKWEKNVALDYIRSKLNNIADDINSVGIDSLIEDASKHPNFIKNKAGEFGSVAHQYIEDLLKQESTPEIPSNMKWVHTNFTKWLNDYKFKSLELEMSLHSNKYGYAGTADAVGYINDSLVILDWKTSTNLYLENLLQVSAYANAYEEMTGKTINSAGVLRLEKRKTGYEFKQIDNISKHFVTFRAVLWLWRFINDPESDYLKIS